MDFLDRLAIWLSGSDAQKSVPSSAVPINEAPKQETQFQDIVVEAMETPMVEDKQLKVREFEESDFEGINPKIVTLGDKLLDNQNEITYNDVISQKHISSQQSLKQDGSILDKVLPFLNNKTDMGVWVYKNRYGVILTMSIYIAVLATMLFVNINIEKSEIVDGIYIEVPAEIEQPQVEMPQEQTSDYTPQRVENIAVDRNVELDASLDDDRNTRTSDLYREAQAAQERLEQNRLEYERGLESVAQLKQEQDAGEGKQDENSQKSINKAGNVAVEYDLKGRYVVDPEIPAYRCLGSGKVVLEVEVGQDGKVLSSKIISMQGVSDECLPLMATEAARATIFNIDYKAPKRAVGVITFTFVAQ